MSALRYVFVVSEIHPCQLKGFLVGVYAGRRVARHTYIHEVEERMELCTSYKDLLTRPFT